MKPTEDTQATFSIQRYDEASITINDTLLTQAVIVDTFEGFTDSPVQQLSEITSSWLEALIKDKKDLRLILIDSGTTYQSLDPHLIALCHRYRVAIETITRPSIYRYFSLLANDGYRVIGLFLSHGQKEHA